jgi:hypothetical protein
VGRYQWLVGWPGGASSPQQATGRSQITLGKGGAAWAYAWNATGSPVKNRATLAKVLSGSVAEVFLLKENDYEGTTEIIAYDDSDGSLRAIKDAGTRSGRSELLLVGDFATIDGTPIANKAVLFDTLTNDYDEFTQAIPGPPALITGAYVSTVLQASPDLPTEYTPDEVAAGAAYSRQLAPNAGVVTSWEVSGPAGMTITSGGLVEWNPVVGTANGYTIRVYGGNDSDFDTSSYKLWAPTVLPTIPAISNATHNLSSGSTYTFDSGTGYVQGDSLLSYAPLILPAGATVDYQFPGPHANGHPFDQAVKVQWTGITAGDAGPHTFSFRAINAAGTSQPDGDVTWTVTVVDDL